MFKFNNNLIIGLYSRSNSSQLFDYSSNSLNNILFVHYSGHEKSVSQVIHDLSNKVSVHYLKNGLKNGRFDDRTAFHHLNSWLVRYSDPNCILITTVMNLSGILSGTEFQSKSNNPSLCVLHFLIFTKKKSFFIASKKYWKCLLLLGVHYFTSQKLGGLIYNILAEREKEDP